MHSPSSMSNMFRVEKYSINQLCMRLSMHTGKNSSSLNKYHHPDTSFPSLQLLVLDSKHVSKQRPSGSLIEIPFCFNGEDRGCSDGKVCWGMGSLCIAPLDNGYPCYENKQCKSGNCLAPVCAPVGWTDVGKAITDFARDVENTIVGGVTNLYLGTVVDVKNLISEAAGDINALNNAAEKALAQSSAEVQRVADEAKRAADAAAADAAAAATKALADAEAAAQKALADAEAIANQARNAVNSAVSTVSNAARNAGKAIKKFFG
jgi:hypothetical protein